jgi:hypothetical protein
MTRPDRDGPPVESPLAGLERVLIDEYVRNHGCDPSQLGELSEPAREALLKAASVHASARLSEIESRSQFVHEIHDVASARPKTRHE